MDQDLFKQKHERLGFILCFRQFHSVELMLWMAVHVKHHVAREVRSRYDPSSKTRLGSLKESRNRYLDKSGENTL